MFHQQTRSERSSSKLSRLARGAITTAGGFLLALAMQAHATVMPGDNFDFNWTETAGSMIGLTGSIELTVGASQGGGFFDVAGFNITLTGGFCGVCTPVSEDLTGATFNANTLGIFGDITGSFNGSGGHLHTFVLDLADIVGGTGLWSFINTKVSDGSVDTASGTYTPLVPSVPEPATLALLGIGLAGLGFARRKQ